ncbi:MULTISPECIES: PEP-CTERM sorting domain-containing protein [unclassified Lentimonas]|uniref:PEP-CTERM sorting domain-containing protein n=1 Tax=unclassified Lentimonas TaxID=2630993 RepID=UPI0013240862|nr:MULTISPECIES: PEP-CTERM sorting domain-containing protein [unclassified Lentimonas]CAA6690302.1 Unannotated [Lentimonas sp. CC19]CAA6690763.1 Unannotated [Lentimonas sp. CC10]CAA7068551.1 Unannotated [Lentimonas sp. CC11]
MKLFSLLPFLALFTAPTAWGVISLTVDSSDTAYWAPIIYLNTSDPVNDAQTSNGGGEADLVGDTVAGVDYYALYKGFDFGANPGGKTSVDLDGDESLAFRARVGGDDNPSGFGSALWIGIDLGATGGFDYFIGIYDSNGSDDIGLYQFDTQGGATSLEDTKKAVYTQVAWAGTVADVDMSAGMGGDFFSSADSVGDPVDIDGLSNPDYLVQFELDFSDLATAMGLTDAGLFDTQIGFGLWTSQNLNQVNNDVNGHDGNDPLADDGLSPSMTYTPSGDSPVPEPAAYALLLGFSVLGVVAVRRRR